MQSDYSVYNNYGNQTIIQRFVPLFAYNQTVSQRLGGKDNHSHK